MLKCFSRIPSFAGAALSALSFSGDRADCVSRLSESEWEDLIKFSDREQLTLAIATTCLQHVPAKIKSRLERKLANSADRWERIRATFQECASLFEQAEIPFVVLKGFSHCPDFVADPRLRNQYDLDLLFQPAHITHAYKILCELGYEPIRDGLKTPTDHVPTMIRKTGWEWRGDFFDPKIPVSIELHFRLWDDETECPASTGLALFWERRQRRQIEGLSYSALHPIDSVGYSALHILRHLLRGSPRLSHIHELASFLHRRSADEYFWDQWNEWHDPRLKRLECISFALARAWFNCELPQAVHAQIANLPPDLRRWLEKYSESPLIGIFRPNKDEVWLHWSLLEFPKARLAMLRRRLLPHRLPGPVQAIHTPRHQITLRVNLMRHWTHLLFILSRSNYHLRALLPTAWRAIGWWGSDTH